MPSNQDPTVVHKSHEVTGTPYRGRGRDIALFVCIGMHRKGRPAASRVGDGRSGDLMDLVDS